MTIILSHNSALEFYRHTLAVPGIAFDPLASSAAKPFSCERMLRQLESRGCGYLSLPVHLLATRSEDRRRSSCTAWHVHEGALPPGSLLRISRDVAVESPELCFTRLASSLSRPKLIKIGLELCGTYALRPDLDEGFVKKQQPSTNIAALTRFLNSCKPLKGRAEATRTLKYLQEGSASPMETIAAMLLFLPHRMGGQALKKGQLNQIVAANDYTHALTGKAFLKCDILWPETRLCVEYDSDQRHTGSDRIAEDASRRAALTYLGYEVVTMTRRHVLDLNAFNNIALLLRKCLKMRDRGVASPREKQRELRSQIIEFSHSSKTAAPWVTEWLAKPR